MTEGIFKTSVFKLMRAERVVGKGSVKNHKMVRKNLGKRFLSVKISNYSQDQTKGIK